MEINRVEDLRMIGFSPNPESKIDFEFIILSNHRAIPALTSMEEQTPLPEQIRRECKHLGLRLIDLRIETLVAIQHVPNDELKLLFILPFRFENNEEFHNDFNSKLDSIWKLEPEQRKQSVLSLAHQFQAELWLYDEDLIQSRNYRK